MFHTEALRLEELLAAHGVAVRVGQASLSTDAVRFPLQLGLGTTTRRLLTLSHELARQAGYSRCRLRREGRLLFLELPRGEGAGLRYGDLLERAGQPPTDSALVGMMEGGASVLLTMTNPAMQHWMVTGEGRIGKSELLRVLALGMASHHSPRHWRLALLESQRAGTLEPLRDLPHAWAWSERPEAAIGWLVRLVTELGEREAQEIAWPHVLVLVDEVERLLAAGGHIAHAVLETLLERGAAVGLHLVLSCRDEAALGNLGTLCQVRLHGSAEQGAGRFTLHFQEEEAPILAARLDDAEALTVVQRMGEQRIRLVAHPVAGGAA